MCSHRHHTDVAEVCAASARHNTTHFGGFSYTRNDNIIRQFGDSVEIYDPNPACVALTVTRPIARGVGRGRAGHARPKETAGRRLSWCAIEQPATRGERTEESLYSAAPVVPEIYLSIYLSLH